MTEEAFQAALRPGHGEFGRPIDVKANFFEIVHSGIQNLHHYHITILPSAALTIKYRRKVWKTFEERERLRGIFKNIKPVHDYHSNLFTIQPLELGEENRRDFQVIIDGTVRHIVSLKRTGSFHLEDLQRFLEDSACYDSVNCLPATMMLNILFRLIPRVNLTCVGNKFHSSEYKQAIIGGIELWRGFFQSVRPTVGKLMIKLDTHACYFYESCLLPDLVVKVLGYRTVADLRQGVSDLDLQTLQRLLKGLRVSLVHRGGNRVVKKIKSVMTTSASASRYTDNDGNSISFVEHFRRRYNRDLRLPFLPYIVTYGESALPMEVCRVEPDQRVLSFYYKTKEQSIEMAKATRLPPKESLNAIMQGLNVLKLKDNPYIDEFGLTVAPEMVTIKARVLPSPQIMYHPSSQEAEFTPQGGNWSLRGKKFVIGATLKSWSVVNFTSATTTPIIQVFIRELCEMFVEKGIDVSHLQPPILSGDPHSDIEARLKEAWVSAGNSAKSEPQIIFCILPDNKSKLYSEIKRVCETVIGIPNQCVKSSCVNNANKERFAHISLKVNMKLGGTNFYLNPKHTSFFSERPTIVIGANVIHPDYYQGAGDPSIAALSASLDPQISKYTTAVRQQSPYVTTIVGLPNMILEVLQAYNQKNQRKPERILFYRCGVSEGEFKYTLESEIPAIYAACASFEANYKPLLTFMLVQKRHHVKLFPGRPENGDASGNCLPGTVVDSGITHPIYYDFYLQSHAPINGTSRPTHYYVLHDDNDFTPDAIQELTYDLCYNNGRSNRSTSIVPAAYFANLVARRARCHILDNGYEDDRDTPERQTEEGSNSGNVKPSIKEAMYFI